MRELARFAPIGSVHELALVRVVLCGGLAQGLEPIPDLEAKMIGDLAAQAHRTGRKFIGWPTVTHRTGREPEGFEEAVDVDPALGFIPCPATDPRVRITEIRVAVPVMVRG